MCVALIDLSFHLILSGLIEYTMKIFDRTMYSTAFFIFIFVWTCICCGHTYYFARTIHRKYVTHSSCTNGISEELLDSDNTWITLLFFNLKIERCGKV